MKRKRLVSNSGFQAIFCLLGFHILFFGTIFLFGYLLPKCFSSFPWLEFDLIIFFVMLFVLYFFRFNQLKLWRQFFSGLPHLPFEKQLKSIFSKALHYYRLLEKRVCLFCLVYFFIIVVFIMFLFFSSIITLLVEVYWLTDFSLGSDLSLSFLVFLMIVSEFIFLLMGWLSNFKE